MYLRPRPWWPLSLRGHSRSLKMVPIKSLDTVSYSHSIATMAVSLAVSTQYTNVTDTQLPSETARQQEPRYVASLGCSRTATTDVYIGVARCHVWLRSMDAEESRSKEISIFWINEILQITQRISWKETRPSASIIAELNLVKRVLDEVKNSAIVHIVTANDLSTSMLHWIIDKKRKRCILKNAGQMTLKNGIDFE